MAAEHAPLSIARAHMEVAVIRPVHGGYGAGEGNDFVGPVECIGEKLLCAGVKHAGREFIQRAKGAHMCELDLLRKGNCLELFQNCLLYTSRCV